MQVVAEAAVIFVLCNGVVALYRASDLLHLETIVVIYDAHVNPVSSRS